MATQEIVPEGAVLTSAMKSANKSMRLPTKLEPLRNLAEQPAIKKSLPALGALGAIGIAAAAWWAFQSPSQQTLFEGLTDTDKSAVVSALETAGFDHSINSATGAVQVAQDDVQRARIMLAGQGLPKAAPAGNALLADLPLGSSRAVEGETLRAAQEADLARTIEAIDAVKIARVHLATPTPSPFIRDQQSPAASVMLTMQSGRTLSEGQVRAIRQLVASSINGMSPASVSIVDQSGALMSRDGLNADDQNFAIQVQTEERYRQALATLLTPTLGAGNFTAEVHVDIDPSESQATRESFPQNDRALRSEQGNKTSSSTSTTPAVGIPGALSNQPPPASQLTTSQPQQDAPVQTAAGGEANESYSRSFDVGREISVTHQPRGRLRRLSVAVAINEAGKKRSPAEVAALQELVKGAVGFDAARGDLIVVTARPFVTKEETATPVWDNPWFLPLVRQAGAILVALFVYFLIGRPLIKSLRGKGASAVIPAENTAETSTSEGVPGGAKVTLDMIERAPSYEARADLVRNFVRQDREKAAMVVQQLVGTGHER